MLSSHFAFTRVRVAPKNHLSRPLQEEQWLIIEWPEGEDKPTKYWLSNLPASGTIQQLAKSAKVRRRIERDYQEMKQGLGLNQYEGRNWRGFHHHASLCIASYDFLIIQRLKYPERKKTTANARNLPYPTNTNHAEPQRMQRHVCDSILTIRWLLAQSIAITLDRCPCCCDSGSTN